jgi:sulfatase maturation enzyme AslB (radical SAM superfamily)
MNQKIIVIEESQNARSIQQSELERLFGAEHWIRVSFKEQAYRLSGIDDPLSADPGLMEAHDVPSFFRRLFERLPDDSTVFRIHNPVYPLNEALTEEIRTHFPEHLFDYVLSTLTECGLSGFFVERMNKRAITQILTGRPVVMPDGTLNGMRLRSAGRHWASLDLRRFYLDRSFDQLFESPRTVAINCMPHCNKSCLKCQFHSSLLQQRYSHGPSMSLDELQIILNKMQRFARLTTVVPTISGEPLLHPHIAEIVRLIRDAGYQCGFFTNGSLLSREMSKKLLDAGVNAITFSVDSHEPENYRRLQGGDLVEVERNILAFQEEMTRHRGTFNGTVMCVVSNLNHRDIEGYRQKWLARGFKVCFSAQHDIGDSFKPYFVHKKWSPDKRMPCFALWHCLYLSERGSLFSCGSMANTDGFKENIFDLHADELWRSRPLTALRELELSGITPLFCKECSCWTGMMSTWISEHGAVECHTQGTWTALPDAHE